MSNGSSGSVKTIPQDLGYPVLGHAVKFFQDMLQCQRDMYENSNKSQIVETRLLNERPLLLFGPDAHQWVLHNRDGIFSSFGGWEQYIDRVFPGAIMTMDGRSHRYQRRIMQTAFKKDVLEGYLSIMNPVVKQSINAWDVSETIKIYPSVKRTLLEIAAPTFIGKRLDQEADDVLESFVSCVEATLALVRKPLPPFKMWKGVKARKKLERFFTDLLPEKRASISADFFGQFCHAESEDGEKYTDQEIVDHIIFLMMAAHDTTSSALTTMIYNLGKNTEWQSRLREEVLSVGETLSYDDLDKLELISLSMKESMRLYPPVPVMPRRTTEDTEFGGYSIKKGRLVSLCVIHMHHDPDLWTNPEMFDPLRFAEGREEHKQHRFKYTPFGGGAHMCIGQHFAEMQVKVIMSRLLREYKWSIPDDYVMPYQQVPLPKPKDGLPLVLEKLT